MAALCGMLGAAHLTASAFLYFSSGFPIAGLPAFATLGVALDGRAIKMEEWLSSPPARRTRRLRLGFPI